MGARTPALLRVLAVAIMAALVVVVLSKLLPLWTLLAAAGAALALTLWLRARRICCYLCRGSVTEGSWTLWINGRRRLVCLPCLRINGLESTGQ